MESLLDDDVLGIAANLLGCRLETEFDGITTAVTITETEAYAGPDDPASHAYRGLTDRNRVMFGPAGFLYVYRSYGIHWCMNVVVGEPGVPHAVLLRGGEPVAGRAEIIRRRGRDTDLTNGPGKLSQALAVTGDDNGTDLRSGPVRIVAGPGIGNRTVERTPRIGISKAVERPWRFIAAG
ncbi:MAG: DNA-3-methyladenine glycosylase [bacterium]|nr:DNA-3-methyladenine glycosylase [bacterium]